MNKEDILKAIKKARESSKKRKFNQTFDLVINLNKLNLKKPEENVNTFIVLPQGRGKKLKICALVDKELAVQSKSVCDKTIIQDEFGKYTDKKTLRKLASEFDYFIAQANLMVDIAKFFGRVFGPKGKMPNPKAGCIVPPNIDMKMVYNKLQKTVRLQTKNEQAIKCSVGTENMKDEQIQENAFAVYNTVLSGLPKDIENISNVIIKLTMGSPVVISEESKEEKIAIKAKKREVKNA